MNINRNTPVFYINLDDNITRNKSMLKTLHRFDFKNIVRVPGVNTKTIEKVDEYKNIINNDAYNKLVENNKSKQRTNHYELTNGSIGCYLSHMNIYEHVVKNNIDYAIIFEDDCSIACDPVYFWEKMESLKIPDNTDIFLINGVKKQEKRSGRNRFPLLLHHSPTGRNILHRPEPLGLLDAGSTGSRKIALLHTQP